MDAARSIVMAAAMAAGLVFAAHAQPDQTPPPDRHCMSQNPERLKLTEDQQARLADILRTYREGPERRKAIVGLLNRTQWQVYWRTAGIAAC